MTRWALVALLPVVLTGAYGCGGDEPPNDVRVTIAVGTVDPVRLELGEKRFELRCDPPGGTVPDPEAVCSALRDDPRLFKPPPLDSRCAGGVGIPPGISIRGTANGKPVDLHFRCDGPEERTRVQEFWYSTVLPEGAETLTGNAG